MALDGMRMPAG